MHKAAIVVLSVLVGALMTLPPLFAAILSGWCMNPTGGSCRRVTAADWLTGELAGIWMPPFVLALVLVGVIFWLRRASKG